MSGATGAIYGVRLLEVLSSMPDVETHLVVSRWAESTILLETPYKPADVKALADVVHPYENQAAPISSGSFVVQAMVVVPCSMKTLAAIRHGFADNLLARAADVTLKEGRKLILVPRESPLSQVHLENMLGLARMGVTILPPMPAFYSGETTIQDIVDHTVGRILDQLGLEHALTRRWGERRLDPQPG
jgi:4-hydroxy-3-polyprenylbenzoate decarboxylase